MFLKSSRTDGSDLPGGHSGEHSEGTQLGDTAGEHSCRKHCLSGSVTLPLRHSLRTAHQHTSSITQQHVMGSRWVCTCASLVNFNYAETVCTHSDS